MTFVDIAEPAGEALAASLSASAPSPVFVPCDLSDLGAIERLFQDLSAVDILVNNAGNDERHTLDDVTGGYWDDRIAVNLSHLLFCAKHASTNMKRSCGGVILNLGSISWHLGLPEPVVYETAKAGSEGMTRALARELGPSDIRVCTILLGIVGTPQQQQHHATEQVAEIVAQQCLKHRVTPDDVAALAVILASDDARSCMGHAYWVDAGWR